MTKSENVWESKGDMDKVWDYIKENPRLIGVIEEVLVQDAMLQFESKMKEILNEGHQ